MRARARPDSKSRPAKAPRVDSSQPLPQICDRRCDRARGRTESSRPPQTFGSPPTLFDSQVVRRVLYPGAGLLEIIDRVERGGRGGGRGGGKGWGCGGGGGAAEHVELAGKAMRALGPRLTDQRLGGCDRQIGGRRR